MAATGAEPSKATTRDPPPDGSKRLAKRTREVHESREVLAAAPAEIVGGAMLEAAAFALGAEAAAAEAKQEEAAAGRASAKRQRLLQRPPRSLGMSPEEFRTVHACAEAEYRLDECRQACAKRFSQHWRSATIAAISAGKLRAKRWEAEALAGEAASAGECARLEAEMESLEVQALEDRIAKEVAFVRRQEAAAAVAEAEGEVGQLMAAVPRPLRRRGVAAAVLGGCWDE